MQKKRDDDKRRHEQEWDDSASAEPCDVMLIRSDRQGLGVCVRYFLLQASAALFFFTAQTRSPELGNLRISARPPAASYLLRGGESKEARIHPL